MFEDGKLSALPAQLRTSNAIGAASKTANNTTVTVDLQTLPCNSALVAAWALVLSLHAAEDDIVFGICLRESQNEPVAFRVQVPWERASAANFLDTTQQSLDGTSASQQDACKAEPSDDQSGSKLCKFSSVLRLHAQPLQGECQHDINGDSDVSGQPRPLTLSLSRSKQSTHVTLAYDTTVHAQGPVARQLGHFKAAVEALCSKPGQQLNDIRFEDEAGLSLLESWTVEPEPVPNLPYLHHAFEKQARLQPLSIAVGETDSVMTYAELDGGADALATYLIGEINLPNGLVGNVAIFFSKSAFAIMSMLAVLKSGGAYTPIDISWPTQRIQKIFKSAQISSVLCSEDQQSILGAFSSMRVIAVTPALIFNLKKQFSERLTAVALPPPDAPAYIMHTSGSTGTPKGIAISHRAITTSLNALARYFKASPSMRTLQFNSFTFDVSVADIWLTLTRGGRVCLPSEEERFHLDDFIRQERCNFALITPSVAATIDPGLARDRMCVLATIGEAVKPQFLRRHAPNLGADDFVLCDTWGPTEASVIGTGTPPITIARDGQTLSQIAGNIGKPLGCAIFIVSAQNPHILSPAFAPGEIAIVGPTLANGYWGDEVKTNESFRTDLRWAQDPRWRRKLGDSVMERVYLTGDIGRYSEAGDGSIVFMYRKGGYMKVNGLRIDAGEVEAAVVEASQQLDISKKEFTPNGEQVAVCAWERAVGESNQEVLVCFVATSETAGKSELGSEILEKRAEWAAWTQAVAKIMGDIIPRYMVPSMFVFVTKMPFTTAFKLDRKALLALVDGTESDEMLGKYAVGIPSL